MADRVEGVIRERFAFLAKSPEAGHRRKNLTEENVKFFPIYSYLIVISALKQNLCKSFPSFTAAVI
jgi:hypothetical protein